MLFFRLKHGQEAVDGFDAAAPALYYGVQVNLSAGVAGYPVQFLLGTFEPLLSVDALLNLGPVTVQGRDEFMDLGGVKSNVYIIFWIV